MNENGELTCSDPNGGYIEEMKARQLVISVSSFFRSSVISYFTISFEPYGLGKKIVTDNIYKSSNTGDAKYTALTGTITCPIYDYIAVSPKVSMQIDGYETDENDNICAIYKSGILDLHFSESLVGDKIIPDTTNAQQKLDEKISSMISEELNALVVSSQQIANSAVTNGKIASGAVSADKISNSAVTSLKIAENAVINSRIADGSISAGKIADSAVETSKIKGYAVTDAKLASEAVTTAKIKDKAILSGKIADGQVKTINIADEAVTEEKLGNAAVTEGKIKNAAVTVNKIASNAVTTSKINDGAVLRNKLGDGQVSTAKLENGAVTEDKLSSGAVTTAKIGTAQVTEAKLSTEVQEKLNSIPDLSELDIGSLNDGEFAVHYPLQGKKLSIIGDSISTFEGYVPSGYSHFYPQQNNDITSVNQTWWKQLANETKLTILKNCSWSGSFVTNDPNNPISTAKCASTDARINDLADGNTTPDIVICQIGVNDFRYNSEDSDSRLIPLGSYDGTTVLPAEANISTFSEAYGLMLKKVMSTYPNAKVYCCTLLEAGSVSFDSNDSGEKIFPCVRGEDGASLASFNDRIRTLAKNMGAKLIDLHDCGINYWNLTTYTHDKVHPNADGAKLLKDKIKSELLSGTITLADVSDNEVIPSNYVTTDTAQTVSGTKTFTGNNGNLSIENGEISGSPLSKASHIQPSQVSVHELEGSNASDLKTHHTKLDGKNGFVHQISDLSTGNDFSGSMVTSVNNGSPETKIVLKKGSNQSCEYKLPGFSAGASKTLVTVDEIPTALSDLTDDLGSSPTHTHSQYLTSYNEFVVTYTQINGAWTADKTYSEMLAAYNAGKTLMAKAVLNQQGLTAHLEMRLNLYIENSAFGFSTYTVDIFTGVMTVIDIAHSSVDGVGMIMTTFNGTIN
ncbi:MAG: hypothetical protein IJS17_07155 [Clostridia bacterium]|nr:hypothetical protein [Clostridia bacterium]